MADNKKAIYFNQDNHLNDLAISLCVEALQTEQESRLPEEIQLHLQKCEICKREVLEFYEAYSYINQETSHENIGSGAKQAQGKRKIKNKFFFSIAAVFLVALISTILLWPAFYSHKSFKSPEYITNTELEDLVNEVYRSGEVVFAQPENGATIRIPVVFKWQANDIDTFYVRIMDNKENIVFETRTTVPSFKLTKKLSPGLYYWKLESKDDLLRVGKFYIKN